MKLLFASLVVVAFGSVASYATDGAPSATFRIAASRSGGQATSPQIYVTFANGLTDRLLLQKHNPMPSTAGYDHAAACNYLGRLAGEPGSSAAVTGCLDRDGQIQVTLFSKHSADQLFTVDVEGLTEVTSHPFDSLNAQSRASDIVMRRDDAGDDGHVVESACATSGACVLPAKLKMVVRLGHDRSFQQAVGGSSNVVPRMASIMTHVQAHFNHESLCTQIELEVKGDPLSVASTWTADNNLGDARKIPSNPESDVSTYIWLVEGHVYGVIGIAYLGVLCENSWKASINEMASTDAGTAKTIAHEVGHNMGMEHDFDNKHSGRGCTGIMDYGTTPDSWSVCSRDDFTDLYQSRQWGGSCLEILDSTDCSGGGDGGGGGGGGDGGGTDPDPPSCVDNWIGDDYCDDENNNEQCQFDGGDCCQTNPNNGWDDYCSACECMSPVCIDNWIGDQYCDDENNNENCGFDGGDCCQTDPMNGWDDYCSDCECLSPICIDHWIGDDYCDDENNNEGCGFDGNDCCQTNPSNGWDDYCSICKCHKCLNKKAKRFHNNVNNDTP